MIHYLCELVCKGLSSGLISSQLLINSLNRVFAPSFPSSPSETPIILTSACFVVFHKACRLSLLFFIMFSFPLGYFKVSILEITDSIFSLICSAKRDALYCSFYFIH